MKLAMIIHTALLPQNPGIKGYDIAIHMTPAKQVGDDYYDIINFDEMDWIVIGDVSGHGLPAGLVMMILQTSIKTVLYQFPNLHPSSLLKVVNRVITGNIRALGENKYITLTALSCVNDGNFFFSGLHEDIVIYRKKLRDI